MIVLKAHAPFSAPPKLPLPFVRSDPVTGSTVGPTLTVADPFGVRFSPDGSQVAVSKNVTPLSVWAARVRPSLEKLMCLRNAPDPEARTRSAGCQSPVCQRWISSLSAAASILPSGEKATALSGRDSGNDLNGERGFSTSRAQRRTVPSQLAVARILSSGEKATDVTASWCPRKVERVSL